jgi:hypothetical protein
MASQQRTRDTVTPNTDSSTNFAVEVDTPWLDDEWLACHPEFPLNPAAIANTPDGKSFDMKRSRI